MAGVGWAGSDELPSSGLAIYSSDGVNWSQATASDGSFENVDIEDLNASPTEYVAVGSTTSEDEDITLRTGRIWVSADGKSWRSLGNFGGVFSQYGASALGPNGLVVFTSNEVEVGDEGDVASTIYGWFIPTAALTP
jgi:hypothetical protein